MGFQDQTRVSLMQAKCPPCCAIALAPMAIFSSLEVMTSGTDRRRGDSGFVSWSPGFYHPHIHTHYKVLWDPQGLPQAQETNF